MINSTVPKLGKAGLIELLLSLEDGDAAVAALQRVTFADFTVIALRDLCKEAGVAPVPRVKCDLVRRLEAVARLQIPFGKGFCFYF